MTADGPALPEPSYWWLSFGDRAHDPEFGSVALRLGVAIVLARDLRGAVRLAWLCHCNPGGEVAGSPLGFGREIVRRVPGWQGLTHRLLGEPEITAAQFIVDRERKGSS